MQVFFTRNGQEVNNLLCMSLQHIEQPSNAEWSSNHTTLFLGNPPLQLTNGNILPVAASCSFESTEGRELGMEK